MPYRTGAKPVNVRKALTKGEVLQAIREFGESEEDLADIDNDVFETGRFCVADDLDLNRISDETEMVEFRYSKSLEE